jgi:hypothetical protein
MIMSALKQDSGARKEACLNTGATQVVGHHWLSSISDLHWRSKEAYDG